MKNKITFLNGIECNMNVAKSCGTCKFSKSGRFKKEISYGYLHQKYTCYIADGWCKESKLYTYHLMVCDKYKKGNVKKRIEHFKDRAKKYAVNIFKKIKE